MKTILTILSLLIVLTASAQTTVTKDKNGNYLQAKRADTGANKATGHVYIDNKGKSYPVLMSSRGKLYYNRVAIKSGNVYKCYLKD